MDGFNTLVSQGKVRYLAVSNRTGGATGAESDALATVAANASRRIIGVQNRYNLLQRAWVSALGDTATLSDEAAFLDTLGRKQIGLIPYMPLAVGMLTGRYRKGEIDSTGRLSQQD